MDDSTQFQARLFGTFIKEAAAHVGAIPALLGRLEQGGDQLETLHDLLREIHSLKGAAGAVEQDQIEFLCSSLEQVLLKIQRGERDIDALFFEVFQYGLALLKDGLTEVAQGGKFMISLQFLESMRKLT